MLARLAKGKANVSEIAEPFLGKMSLPAVTKHLKVLVNAGLVIKSQDAQRRPCELNPTALKSAAEWMEQYRVHWEESFDRLDEYLKKVQSTKASNSQTKSAASTRIKSKPTSPPPSRKQTSPNPRKKNVKQKK
jgi:DNA-binding transcriptional ArsR family regulator